MKIRKRWILLALLTINAIIWSAQATANINCGVKPLRPIKCGKKAQAVCMCDEHGNCKWVWVGC